MEDFNIIIGQPDSGGKVTVTSGEGELLGLCDNGHDAAVYARGVQDGYRAARYRLGNAHIRRETKAIADVGAVLPLSAIRRRGAFEHHVTAVEVERVLSQLDSFTAPIRDVTQVLIGGDLERTAEIWASDYSLDGGAEPQFTRLR